LLKPSAINVLLGRVLFSDAIVAAISIASSVATAVQPQAYVGCCLVLPLCQGMAPHTGRFQACMSVK
jgi:hypothetical protein